MVLWTQNDGSRIAEAIARIDIIRGESLYAIPLLRAAASGIAVLAMVGPGEVLPLHLLSAHGQKKPLIVLLMGDYGSAQVGPRSFPQARRLLRWSRTTMLHGAAGEPESYAAIVATAPEARRVLIVNTSGPSLPAWIGLAERIASGTPTAIVAPVLPAAPRVGSIH